MPDQVSFGVSTLALDWIRGTE